MMWSNPNNIEVCEIFEGAIVSGPGKLPQPTMGYLLPTKYVSDQFDPDAQVLGEAVTTILDDCVEFRFPAVDLPTEVVIENLKAAYIELLKKNRQAKEIAGVEFAGLATISTDRDSQTLLANAVLQAENSDIDNWILSTHQGPVTVSKETLLAVATEVFRHVQSCFSEQRTKEDMVRAATTVEEIKAAAV